MPPPEFQPGPIADLLSVNPRRVEIAQRIADRIEIDPESGCWIWQGPDSGNGRGGGYPRMSLNGQSVAVHRVAYTLAHGYVPGRKHIDHKCRTRLCVNPDPEHLELVSHRENCRRRDAAQSSAKDS